MALRFFWPREMRTARSLPDTSPRPQPRMLRHHPRPCIKPTWRVRHNLEAPTISRQASLALVYPVTCDIVTIGDLTHVQAPSHVCEVPSLRILCSLTSVSIAF